MMAKDIPETPFMWKELPNGSVIIDEMCRCGHKRSNHGPGPANEDGHGACARTKCKCKRFVFENWITIPNPKIKD
jgi:hypothetical protein